MLRIIVGVILFFVLGFAFFPQFKGALLALASFAFLLICPLSMIVGMCFMGKGMKTGDKTDRTPRVSSNEGHHE